MWPQLSPELLGYSHGCWNQCTTRPVFQLSSGSYLSSFCFNFLTLQPLNALILGWNSIMWLKSTTSTVKLFPCICPALCKQPEARIKCPTSLCLPCWGSVETPLHFCIKPKTCPVSWLCYCYYPTLSLSLCRNIGGAFRCSLCNMVPHSTGCEFFAHLVHVLDSPTLHGIKSSAKGQSHARI